jgi:GPI ethanolamine phosphate transferase 1
MTKNEINLNLVLKAVLIHLIIFYSIFDIYFKSHLITGINEINDYDELAPAKRLVLISADGLREDTTRRALDNDQIPFLK